MKKTRLFLLPALLFLTFAAAAQETSSGSGYSTALGVRLSSSNAMVNNSVSLKHFINDKLAIEGLFSFGDPLAIGALAEIHKPLASEGLTWFYGGGGYISFVKKVNTTTQKTTTDPNFGAMGVIGLDYKFNNIPLNLSLDWKPELNIVSDINFEPAAIGFTARFTFGK
ncbi:MAG: hypothetical protein JNM88_01110 [Chitinophagaceae bacterium]|nr:hypothetical protein [Chitinophagaceae bacterium]